MLTRNTVVKVLVFAVVGVVAVAYTAMRYAGLGTSIINPGYTVRLELASSGGIFTNAEVTYRGYQVGKVTGMRLTQDGLEVDLHINSSAPQIPTNLKATVADRSAVGEQYVDLTPNTDAGPYLADGSVISVDHTSIPLPTQNLLTNVNSLATSVPVQALQTTVNELDTAFSGTGGDLQKLLDSLSSFIATAGQQLPQTTQLLQASGTVLNTQNYDASAIKSFSGSLQQLAAQLKTSDPNIRTLIANAPLAGSQLTDLLNESGAALGSVIANLLTTSNILVSRQSGLREALVAYPQVTAGTSSVVPGDGYAHLGLVLNVFDPVPCTKGYQGTQKRAGNVTTSAAPNVDAYCADGTGSSTDVRGAQNAPDGGGLGAPATSGAFGGGSPQTPAAAAPVLGGSGGSLLTLAQLLGVG